MQRIGVVGCGLMGAGIVEVCARAGRDVTILEVSRESIASGRKRLDSSLDWAQRTGKLSSVEREQLIAQIRFTADIADLAECELVIESAAEDRAIKLELFRSLDEVVTSDTAILASNTSSIPISKLARATKRPGSVIGLHFFNPVPIMPLVEIVRSLRTSDDTVSRCRAFTVDVLGKRPIEAKDRSGFIVNVLLVPYLLSAVRLVESGFASAADIDAGMTLGAAHPMGPLAVLDFIGIDTLLGAAEVLYDEFKDPMYAPPPLLSRMVDAGLLGRKSGSGFHSYS